MGLNPRSSWLVNQEGFIFKINNLILVILYLGSSLNSVRLISRWGSIELQVHSFTPKYKWRIDTDGLFVLYYKLTDDELLEQLRKGDPINLKWQVRNLCSFLILSCKCVIGQASIKRSNAKSLHYSAIVWESIRKKWNFNFVISDDSNIKIKPDSTLKCNLDSLLIEELVLSVSAASFWINQITIPRPPK